MDVPHEAAIVAKDRAKMRQSNGIQEITKVVMVDRIKSPFYDGGRPS